MWATQKFIFRTGIKEKFVSSPIRPGFFFCMHLVVIIHTRVMDKICPFSFSVVCVKLMLFSDIFLFIVPAFHVESLAGSVRWAETYQLGKLKWRGKKTWLQTTTYNKRWDCIIILKEDYSRTFPPLLTIYSPVF